MSGQNRVRIEVFLNEEEVLPQMESDVRQGLTSNPKFLLPKYFYDNVGSLLFEKITTLPEYYLTRTETRLISELSDSLISTIHPTEILELGAGSSTKTLLLINKWENSPGEKIYLPFDVNLSMIEVASKELITKHPWLSVHGIVGDFERHLHQIPICNGTRLILFLGSTIGNFTPDERINFLKKVSPLLKDNDRFLIGLDLVKDVQEIEAAYNDNQGVTEAFNKNILNVINHNLHGNFQPDLFRHSAFFNPNEQRIEMHLISSEEQQIDIQKLKLPVFLKQGESIWTESSHKFTQNQVRAMLSEAGLRLVDWFQDREAKFALALAGSL